MKALFIAFDQAHYEDVYNVLTHNNLSLIHISEPTRP